MASGIFTAAAWRNGSQTASGAGYGLRLTKTDRDRHFRRHWGTVTLHLPETADVVEVNIENQSFWTGCRELRHKKIGVWLLSQGLAPWPKGKPPKITIISKGERIFVVSRLLPPR